MSSLSKLKEAMSEIGFGVDAEFDALTVIAALKHIIYISEISTEEIKGIHYKKFNKEGSQGVIICVGAFEYICEKYAKFVKVKENGHVVGYVLKDYTYPSTTIFLNRFKENSFKNLLESLVQNVQNIRDLSGEEFVINTSGTMESVLPSIVSRDTIPGVVIEAAVALLIFQLKKNCKDIVVDQRTNKHGCKVVIIGDLYVYPEQCLVYLKTDVNDFVLKEGLQAYNTKISTGSIAQVFNKMLWHLKENGESNLLNYYVQDHGNYSFVSLWISPISSVSPIFSIKLERV